MRLAPWSAAAFAATLFASARAEALPFPDAISLHESDPLVQAGYLPVTLYDGVDGLRVDPTGQEDSTAGIQRAIEDGREYGMVTYLPAGTYLISDTLVGEQFFQTWGCADFLSPGHNVPGRPVIDYGTGIGMRKAANLVGPSSGGKAILRLKDGSAGFGDPASPKAALHFFNNGPGYGSEFELNNPWTGQFDCGMNLHVRNIELHLGSGNPGAIGVQIPSAQYSSLQDVRIDATGAYAGIRGIVSTRAAVNLEVKGGRYGVILAIGAENLANVVLEDQDVAAVVVSTSSPVSLVGFRIVKDQGPAILIDNSYATFGPQSSQLTLYDGSIELASGSEAAIRNDAEASIYLRNVYVRNAGAVVQSGSVQQPATDSLTRVAEYVYTDTGGAGAATLVDGVLGNAPIANLEAATSIPSDLASRHARRPLPWFAQSGAFNVRDAGAQGDGSTDDTDALQEAIDQHELVFIPRGDYRISRPLVLHASTTLTGVPGGKSRIFADTLSTTDFAPMIRTDDDAAATTLVSDVWLRLPGGTYEATKVSAIEWRAGRQSVINELYYDIPWEQDLDAAPRKVFRVTGSGGGRVYSPTLGQLYDGRTRNEDHRALFVDGTSEPLTIYGFNSEYMNSTMIELKDAENVRMFGNKTEVLHTYLSVQGSRNVLHTGMAGHCGGQGLHCDGTQIAISVAGSSDVVLAHETFYQGSHDAAEMVHDDGGGSIPGLQNCSYYRRGTFDDSVFPYCGDGQCDPNNELGTDCSDCPVADGGVDCETGDACEEGGGSGGAGPEDGGTGEDGAAGVQDGGKDGASGQGPGAATPAGDGGESCACTTAGRGFPARWLAVLLSILAVVAARRVRR